MERFKVCEKETKTKAYSKEGLSMQTKKGKDKDDGPKQAIYQWIDDMTEQLSEQQSELESQMEGFGAGGKKKGK